MAEAARKIKALCPPKPVVEKKPEPVPPAPKPTPPPPPPAAEPVKIVLEDIHFEFDMASLTKVALDILDSNIRILKENQGVNVQIEGIPVRG
jgi:OOP family OmpA-OmpF porin